MFDVTKLRESRHVSPSHTLAKCFGKKVLKLFTAWATVRLPTCNEDD